MLKTGRTFISAMAKGRILTGRDGALRRPRLGRALALQKRRNSWGPAYAMDYSFRPLLRGRGHRSAMSLPLGGKPSRILVGQKVFSLPEISRLF